jgi:hypothetical protein
MTLFRVFRTLIAPALLALALATPAALGSSSQTLPAATGKLKICTKTLFKVGGRLRVTVDVGAQKRKHPPKSALSCTNAQAVALAGKKYYRKYPFGLGKKIKVSGQTYTMGRAVLAGASGPTYGWAGDRIVVYLINATG